MQHKHFKKFIIIPFIITVIFWIMLLVISKYALVGEETLNTLRLITQIPLAIIPFIGGVLGIKNSITWGGTKSIMGRSSMFLGLGLLAWSSGMIAWNYYIFFTNIEIPYPSLADVGYVFGLLFFVIGIATLSKAVGVKFALKNKSGKILLLVIPAIIILISAYLLVYIARGGVLFNPSGGYLKLFFDLLYPLGDVVILTMTSVVYFLSKNLLGGKYKTPILILFSGFLMFYISDFMFSYTTTKGTYFNGHFVDFLFTSTMFILSLSLTMLSPSYLNSKENQNK